MEGKGVCTVICCNKEVKQRGLCKTHLSRFYRTGSTERTRAENKGHLCRVMECKQAAWKSGYCTAHYLRLKRSGDPSPRPLKRVHALYPLWFERKRSGALCDEWMDFWKFVEGIGAKPSPNHFLMRRRGDAPFGPENFIWREKLKKRADETVKEWHARKWASRMAAFPTYDQSRKFLSNYGITLAQYQEMLASQEEKCAICEERETSVDRAGTLKSLAVDHCHNTGKVRGLLCSRCNTTIGKLEESPQLLRAMFDYLHKHAAA
jgi:hypothetical protein